MQPQGHDYVTENKDIGLYFLEILGMDFNPHFAHDELCGKLSYFFKRVVASVKWGCDI